eukprot:350674-Chlamydomonas_euryale.AAC.3
MNGRGGRREALPQDARPVRAVQMQRAWTSQAGEVHERCTALYHSCTAILRNALYLGLPGEQGAGAVHREALAGKSFADPFVRSVPWDQFLKRPPLATSPPLSPSPILPPCSSPLPLSRAGGIPLLKSSIFKSLSGFPRAGVAHACSHRARRRCRNARCCRWAVARGAARGGVAGAVKGVAPHLLAHRRRHRQGHVLSRCPTGWRNTLRAGLAPASKRTGSASRALAYRPPSSLTVATSVRLVRGVTSLLQTLDPKPYPCSKRINDRFFKCGVQRAGAHIFDRFASSCRLRLCTAGCVQTPAWGMYSRGETNCRKRTEVQAGEAESVGGWVWEAQLHELVWGMPSRVASPTRTGSTDSLAGRRLLQRGLCCREAFAAGRPLLPGGLGDRPIQTKANQNTKQITR